MSVHKEVLKGRAKLQRQQMRMMSESGKCQSVFGLKTRSFEDTSAHPVRMAKRQGSAPNAGMRADITRELNALDPTA